MVVMVVEVCNRDGNDYGSVSDIMGNMGIVAVAWGWRWRWWRFINDGGYGG